MDPYQILSDHNIPFVRVDHPAVFTCEEAEEKASHVPGTPAKNLFLESGKSGKLYLVSLTYEKRANLKHLSEFLDEKKLHFGSPEKLMEHLGVTPGAVSPLGLINDSEHAVTFVLDRDFLEKEKIHPVRNPQVTPESPGESEDTTQTSQQRNISNGINVHPNDNTASLVFAVPDFLRLMTELGYSPKLYQSLP